MRRREFTYDGKKGYVIAELSLSNPKALIAVLESMEVLSSVLMELRATYVRMSGSSQDLTQFYDFNICPMKGEQEFVAGSAAGGAAAAEEEEPVAAKKRRRVEEEEEDEEPAAGAVAAADIDEGLDVFRCDDDYAKEVPQTDTDFYRRYDEQDTTIQVDMSCLLHMIRVSKRSDVLSLAIFSFSPTDSAERILITSSDQNTSTTAVITPQEVMCEIMVLPQLETTFAVTMPSDFFAGNIKEIASASQSSCVSIHMNRLGGPDQQCLTLSATGDMGK